MDRPAGCRFWEAKDVVKWIKTNVPKDQLGSENSSAAAMWFCAVQRAEGFSDFRLKDFAHMLIDGYPALEMSDLTYDLQAPYEDEPELVPEVEDAKFEDSLREFFGLKKKRAGK